MKLSWKTSLFRIAILFFICLISISTTRSQSRPSANKKIWQIASGYKANFGVAWMHFESGDTGGLNGIMHFPMQSVFKFPLALAVLNQVDKGKLRLDQKVRITREDYIAGTWSPIMKKHPEGGVDLTLKEILAYTVTHSDNVGCDVLFRVLGGPSEAEKFVHQSGVKNMMIRFNEKEMLEKWESQFENWSDPSAMVLLLEKFYRGELLKPKSNRLLKTMMEETSTGPKRIRGLLPPETVVAHRTGTGGRDPQGNASAANDVGIITLPDNTHLVLAVFISNAPEPYEELEKAIASISKELFDHYSSDRIRKQ